MQLQFQKSAVSCLNTVRSGIQYQEQTQELRLPEQMPDVGSILGAWGQVLIRSKEWRSGSMSVSGGVMTWAMYRPEEGSQPQMVEAWIPFQMKMDLPQTQYDGVIRVNPLLKGVDARVTSARKVMLRICVGVLCEATVPMSADVYEPQQIPEGIHLLTNTYPVCLPKEAGERSFTLEEELTLPASAPAVEKLLRFSLHPELIDQKVMSGKVVFRGAALIHILYLGTDGQLHSCELQTNFSQYGELESDYDEQAYADIWMALTALEMDMDEQGQLCIKAGLTGQYMILQRELIRVVEDAYGTAYKVTAQTQQLLLPMVLDEQKQLLHAQAEGKDQQLQPLDVAFYPDQPHIDRDDGGFTVQLGGYFQILGYDQQGNIAGTSARWEDTQRLPGCTDCSLQMWLNPSAQPQLSSMGDAASADVLLRAVATSQRPILMLTALEAEAFQPDPMRPSLILRRSNDESLWSIAKENGSTEQAIRQANQLTSDPEPGQLLLIPVI